MKPTRWLLTFLGLAALSAISILVGDAEAADNAGIATIAEALKGGNAAAAKAAAAAFAAKNKAAGVAAVMECFGKNELLKDGIGKKLLEFQKAGVKAADFARPDFQNIGMMTAAIGLVSKEFPAPKNAKGTPAEWTQFSNDLVVNGMGLHAAFQAKAPIPASKAAAAINESCAKCHVKFK